MRTFLIIAFLAAAEALTNKPVIKAQPAAKKLKQEVTPKLKQEVKQSESKPFLESQLAAKQIEQEMAGSDKPKPKIEAWYINMEKHKDRKECMELQLREQGFEPHREEGTQWPSNHKSDSFNMARIKSMGLGDCVPNGINVKSTGDHMAKTVDEDTLRANILSNYCGHKRLIEKLAKSNSTAEYFLIFEDDAQLKPWFRLMLEDFVQNYDGPWSAVQIDPFWVHSTSTTVKKELAKTYKNKNIYHGGVMSGIQTLLVKKAHIQDIITTLNKQQAMPADHIGRFVDSMIAWKPYISTHPGWWGEQVNEKCPASVRQSRIGSKDKTKTAQFLAKEGFPMQIPDEQVDDHMEVNPQDNGPQSVLNNLD